MSQSQVKTDKSEIVVSLEELVEAAWRKLDLIEVILQKPQTSPSAVCF